MERRFEDTLDRRPSSERRLGVGRARAPARLDLPRIAVPRERRQLSSNRASEQSLHRLGRALSQLADGVFFRNTPPPVFISVLVGVGVTGLVAGAITALALVLIVRQPDRLTASA